MARLFGETDRAPRPVAAPSTASGGATAPAAAPPNAEATTDAWERMAAEARDTYQRALEAQRAGDWAKYGEEIKRLGELLERMRRR